MYKLYGVKSAGRAEFDKGSERALAYAKQCERAVSGLLRDEDFYFGMTEDTV